MAKVTIEVTQSDIERGTTGDCYGCPIAIAIERVLAPTHYAGACSTHIAIRRKDKFEDNTRVAIPLTASRFVLDFDHNLEKPAPFSFDLEVPNDLLASAT